jgi:hypothetical protein
MPRARNRRFRSSANQGTTGEASEANKSSHQRNSLVVWTRRFIPSFGLPPASNNHLRVIPDPTPGTHHTGSTDVLYFLPIVGPCTAWLAFHLASHAVANGEHVWSTDTLARLVGLGGNRSKLWASLGRLAYFELGEFVATDTMTIRLHLPRMADHHLDDSPMHSPSSTGTETSTAER